MKKEDQPGIPWLKCPRRCRIALLSSTLLTLALTLGTGFGLANAGTQDHLWNQASEHLGQLRTQAQSLAVAWNEEAARSAPQLEACRETLGSDPVCDGLAEALAASDGKVDDETSRTALKTAADRVEELLAQEPEHRLETYALAEEVTEQAGGLEDGREQVAQAVQAREKRLEEARKEAERLAAIRATSPRSASSAAAVSTRSSAAPAAASSTSSATPAAPAAPAARTWTLNASYCADPFAAQSCVDSYGVSYVDFSPWGGPRWIGGHNGGAAGVILNFQPGDIVTVYGSGAGTYRITGSTWIPRVTGQGVSSLGGGVAFQTCSGSQMRLVYAVRI